jgi:hypothetical protein
MPDEPSLDAVSDAAGLDDAMYFALNENRDKRFRARLDAGGRLWIVQRRADGTFLRTRSVASKPPRSDDDRPLAYLFYATIWPDLPPVEVRRLARRALRGPAR